jgi:hypothetical protein
MPLNRSFERVQAEAERDAVRDGIDVEPSRRAERDVAAVAGFVWSCEALDAEVICTQRTGVGSVHPARSPKVKIERNHP